MKHARIINIPKNPKIIYDYALSKSYQTWILVDVDIAEKIFNKFNLKKEEYGR